MAKSPPPPSLLDLIKDDRVAAGRSRSRWIDKFPAEYREQLVEARDQWRNGALHNTAYRMALKIREAMRLKGVANIPAVSTLIDWLRN